MYHRFVGFKRGYYSNTGHFKYQVALIDGETHEVVDILECRYKHFLCDYFKKFPKEQLDREKETILYIVHSDEKSDVRISKFNEWVKCNLESDIPQLQECVKTFQYLYVEIKHYFTNFINWFIN